MPIEFLRWVCRFWETDSVMKSPLVSADMVEQARQDWLFAVQFFNQVEDQDMLEYAIYLIKANESKYCYLLRKARQSGLSHPVFRSANNWE